MRGLFYLGIQDGMVLVTHALTQLIQCLLFGRKKLRANQTAPWVFIFYLFLINKI